MPDDLFSQLVASDQPVGEVVAVNDFLVKVRGLAPVAPNGLVLFANGARGLVRSVDRDNVTIFSMSRDPVPVGTEAVLENDAMHTGVGQSLVGRAIGVDGRPLDGGPAIATDNNWPVFNDAPALIDRADLDTQLPTGVTVVDTLFPVVCGQRIAVMGDSRTGKSTFMTQMTRNQAATDKIVVYVLISKRPDEISSLINELQSSGAMDHAVVVATSIFDSPVESYLAPYIGCAIGEYFWRNDRDVIVMYDDLSNHAKIYREMSLLAGISPGRDSYPGDIFYIHSSLLERAGKLADSGKTLTALPLVLTPNNDITSFLATNIISITDGQIVFDVDVFHEGIKPAVHTGLSVSRVGGRGQAPIHKKLAFRLSKALSDYHEASEFAHFTSEMAAETQTNLALGERLVECLKQAPDELLSLLAQQVLLAVAMTADPRIQMDIGGIKRMLATNNLNIPDRNAFDRMVNDIIQQYAIRGQNG